MHEIDLNCDLGEGFPHDAELIALASSVNIACAGHAGDDAAMHNAIRLAKAAGVNIGAHPGYEDRENFGRIEVKLPPPEVAALIHRQLTRLAQAAAAQTARLRHLKPHGALYHVANRDPAIAAAIVHAVRQLNSALAIVCPPATHLAQAAHAAGLQVVSEGFADRRYQPDGTLLPRATPGAVIETETEAAEQALEMILHHQVKPTSGQTIPLHPQTLCVHGDGPHAVSTLRALRRQLDAHNILVNSFR